MVCVGPWRNLIEGLKTKISTLTGNRSLVTKLAVSTYVKLFKILCMEKNSSLKANSSSACQEIPRILFYPNVHYHIHNPLPTVTILTHINPVHASTYHFLKIRFNIIISFTPSFSKWCLSLRSPRQSHVYTSPVSHTCYMPNLSHYSWFDHPKKKKVRSTEYKAPRFVVFSILTISN